MREVDLIIEASGAVEQMEDLLRQTKEMNIRVEAMIAHTEKLTAEIQEYIHRT